MFTDDNKLLLECYIGETLSPTAILAALAKARDEECLKCAHIAIACVTGTEAAIAIAKHRPSMM